MILIFVLVLVYILGFSAQMASLRGIFSNDGEKWPVTAKFDAHDVLMAFTCGLLWPIFLPFTEFFCAMQRLRRRYEGK